MSTPTAKPVAGKQSKFFRVAVEGATTDGRVIDRAFIEQMPDQFNRDIPTMLLDEFSAAFLKGKLAADPVAAVEILAQVQQMTEHCDAPDQARAKLLKAIAYAILAALDQAGTELLTASQRPQAEMAYQLMERAVQLFPGVGVKPTMERLRTRIVKTVPG